MPALALLTGCAYLHDRGRDACDMVTVAVEAPTVNAAIQLGPLPVGFGAADGKGFGLRSGGIGIYDTGELNILCLGSRTFVPRERDLERDKGYEFTYFWIPGCHHQPDWHIHEGKWGNGFQFEAALGLVVGTRVGVNLAEILDFVLGWTTLDICGDDIATIEKKEQLEFKKRKATDNKTTGGDVQ